MLEFVPTSIDWKSLFVWCSAYNFLGGWWWSAVLTWAFAFDFRMALGRQTVLGEQVHKPGPQRIHGPADRRILERPIGDFLIRAHNDNRPTLL